jgi:prevent-host-death family protein
MKAIKEVGAFEAKTHLSALLEQVQQGKRFYITKRGKRVAELGPPEREKKMPRKAGWLKGKIWMSPDFDEPIPGMEEYY